MSLLHLPLWLRPLVYCPPAWLHSAIIHSGYSGWIGGVTGHMVGAFLAVPWSFVRPLLQPRIGRQFAEARSTKEARSFWPFRSNSSEQMPKTLPKTA